MLYVITEPMTALRPEITPFAVIGGDHHIHAWKQPDPETRIGASMAVLVRGAAQARQFGVPLIVNGDLTHDKNNLNPAVTSELMSFFTQEKQMGTRIILSVGNHERTEKYHSLHTLKCFEPVVELVASDPRLIRLTRQGTPLALNVMLVPFYYNHMMAVNEIDRLRLLDQVPAGESCVFVGHYPVDGAEVNGIKPNFGIKYEDFRPEQYEALLFNDIHKAQPVSEKAYHLGCTHQNNFGEEGYDYGWWLVGLWGGDPAAVVIARLPMAAPEFYTVSDEEIVAAEVAQAGFDGYVREKPASVIARSIQEQGAPRIQFKPGDLGGSIEKYLTYQVEQGLMMNDMKAKMLRAVMEILRPANAPGAR